MFAASQRQTNGEALEAARFLIQEFGPFKKTKNGKIINNPSVLICYNYICKSNDE